MSKRHFTEEGWHDDPRFRALCRALIACHDVDEMSCLLRDIGTLSELKAWSERLEVARQLSRGLTYREVAANTRASTTTVTRVAKFLAKGKGGYAAALRALAEPTPPPTSEPQ